MSEKALVLEHDDTVRVHGSDFEVFVNGNGYIGLVFGDRFEDIHWVVEQRQRVQKEKSQ